jgi:hypothetical protein
LRCRHIASVGGTRVKPQPWRDKFGFHVVHVQYGFNFAGFFLYSGFVQIVYVRHRVVIVELNSRKTYFGEFFYFFFKGYFVSNGRPIWVSTGMHVPRADRKLEP